jgi:hypothetical protein
MGGEKDMATKLQLEEKQGALKALADISNLFGENGEHWTQGSYKETYNPGEVNPITPEEKLTREFNRYCLVGGIREVDGTYEYLARVAIAVAIGEGAEQVILPAEDIDEDRYENDTDLEGSIISFNDRESTEWPDIQRVLTEAKELLENDKIVWAN